MRSWALRRAVAVLLAVVPVAAVSLPALAGQEDLAATRDAWLDNREQMADTVETLEVLDVEATRATLELDAVKTRMAKAETNLDDLRGELRRAVDTQEEAEQANEVAIRQLGQATMVLIAIGEALEGHLADLQVEIVAAYKHAGSSARIGGIVDALRTSGSITEYTTISEQLRTGTVGQHELVGVVTELGEQLHDQQQLVAALQRETAKAEREAVAERQHVAKLTRRQARLVNSIDRDRKQQRRLLRELEAQREEYQKQAAELQQQSDALTAELRKYRWVGGAPGSKDLLWPTDGVATSQFGIRIHPIFKEPRLHAGIDIPAATGQAVYGARDGVVLTAGVRGGYGNAVVIDHGDGMSTLYAHLSRILVTAGQEVSAAEVVGQVGSTGYSTGPHLHFEVRLGGQPSDPMAWY